HTATPQQPFYVYIEGAAGTGKSLLINCIAGKATDILASLQEDISTPYVLLTSFTGTAAYNIRGQTLHAAFSLPTSLRLPYQPIPEKALNTLRSRFRNLKILIIDEISMISKTLLLYVHGRLTQLYQSKAFQPFGGISVLVVGDLFQLPPVFGPPLFKIDHAALPAELFTFFQKYSLTKIVRQQMTYHLLLIISETLPEPTEVIHIFANLKTVYDHNTAMLTTLAGPVVNLEAKDTQVQRGKTFFLSKPLSSVKSALLPLVQVKIGARVMLTSNLDVTDGLVNGALGTVTQIQVDEIRNTSETIFIHFDEPDTGRKARKDSRLHHISKDTPIVVKKEVIKQKPLTERLQFPITLCWAVTIHKVQGQTFERAVVSLHNMFRPGMAYVALSRVKTLNGLFLKDFDESAMYSDTAVQDILENMTTFPMGQFSTLSNLEISDSQFLLHQLNIQSVSAHFEDLQKINGFDKSIILLQETFDTLSDHIWMESYTVYRTSSSFSKNRGLLSLFKNSDFDVLFTEDRTTIQYDCHVVVCQFKKTLKKKHIDC
ncbi:ATP-dependent DNA helicase PIF1-like, partial [Artemia franciscana]|uniref:ATP-dependent DNA helicase PIF1-like n=1 Tax=Artemia franciscana TaxID=6661 RepID=UPI0032DBC12E